MILVLEARSLRIGDIIRLAADSLRIEEPPVTTKTRIKIAARSEREAGGIVRRSYLASQRFRVERPEVESPGEVSRTTHLRGREIYECGRDDCPGTTDIAHSAGACPALHATRVALDLALASAKAHGEQSDPDHETGDLLELVEALYAEMNEEQRKRALMKYGEGREWWRA